MENKQKIISHLEKYIRSKVTFVKEYNHEDKQVDFDLAFFRSNRARPYHIVSTVGLSNLKMKGRSKRVELLIYLNKDWNLFSDKDEFAWVYKMMHDIAYNFHISKRAFDYGQTFLTEGSNTFSPSTAMNSAILYCPLGLDNDSWSLKLGMAKTVDFYLVPTATYREYAIIRKIGGLSFVDNYLLEDGDLENLVIYNKKN